MINNSEITNNANYCRNVYLTVTLKRIAYQKQGSKYCCDICLQTLISSVYIYIYIYIYILCCLIVFIIYAQ